MQHAIQASQSPDLPPQTIWAFDDTHNACSPGPTYVNHYGVPILVRNNNALPPANQNGGFGIPSVTTHLYNGHTPSESDGFACDYFEIGHWYDQHYPNVLAGRPNGAPLDPQLSNNFNCLKFFGHLCNETPPPAPIL